MRTARTMLAAGVAAATLFAGTAEAAPVERVDAAAARVQPKVVAWRRDIHQNPELGFEERRTARLVADHLRKLGMEVRTGVGGTGVVGILRGAKPGAAVALRADMDALPVQEQTGLPFASKARGTWEGAAVPVAHACGHDGHVAMLMGAAEILAGMKDEIAGTVIFIFQPAEEGAPAGQVGGARRMMDEGAFADLKPDAIFGLHVVPGETGTLFYRPQGFMAAADRIDVRLRGKQTHGAWPWLGIDIVSVGAQVVNAVNAIAARQTDVRSPAVITLATVQAGARYNIIPDEMTMSGTMRTFEVAQRIDLQERVRRTASLVAESWGASAEVNFTAVAPLTYNDPALSAWLVQSLEQAAGAGKVNPAVPPTTIAEDFSVFQQSVPGVMYHLGISKPGQSSAETAPNHSPYFDVYEPALEVGVKAHVYSALNFLESRAAR